MGEVVVRPLADGEWDAMRDVGVRAFGDETIGGLLDELRASWAWIPELAFVAELDGRIVGQVLYTTAILDAPDRLIDVLVLSPLGVLPELHGQGIGDALVRQSLARLDGRPEPYVFLEGSPRYYPRFGFRPGGDFGVRKPSDRIPDAAFQTIPLATHEPSMTGTLVYPDVFWRLDAVGLR